MKILIADDQILFSESLKIVLEVKSPEFQVIGIVATGKQAIAFVEHRQPDLILMDVKMPVMDGVESTRLIHEKYPTIKIVILTTFPDDSYVRDALAHGATGYLLKDISADKLITAIRSVFDGSVLVSEVVAPQLFHQSLSDRHLVTIAGDNLPEWYRELTRREKDILIMVGNDFDNNEIAERVHLAEQTVKNYISTLYTKLDVHSRTHLIKKIREIIS